MKKIKNFINFIVEDYSSYQSDIYSSPEETQVVSDMMAKPETNIWYDTDNETQDDLNLGDMPIYSPPSENDVVSSDMLGEIKDPLYSLYSKFSQDEIEKEDQDISTKKPFLSKGRKPKYQ